MDESTRKQIEELVSKNQVLLFMKGTRHFPQCGFSSQVVAILNELGPKYETVNILAEGGLRDGMKEFSSWPTFPQLYVKGAFVGGCDIVREMHPSGELAALLGGEGPKPPAITVTWRPPRGRSRARSRGKTSFGSRSPRSSSTTCRSVRASRAISRSRRGESRSASLPPARRAPAGFTSTS